VVEIGEKVKMTTSKQVGWMLWVGGWKVMWKKSEVKWRKVTNSKSGESKVKWQK
jgi:hypothetical protein